MLEDIKQIAKRALWYFKGYLLNGPNCGHTL